MTNPVGEPTANYHLASAARLSAALSYVRRGWPIIPLHDVTMGFCSCGDTSEKHARTSAGKHPIASQWQHAAITDEEILRSVFSGRSGANFGIKTGVTAGVWVLDVDPKNEGDKRLLELVTEYGEMPDTYSVTTGSGGRHYFWRLPGGFTPTNSKGSLPPGLDVRGEGGFVVAAPSVSGIGPYEVLLDAPVADAPEWLLELIRPRVPLDVEHAEASQWMGHQRVTGLTDRYARYAMAAALAEVSKLSSAVPGERGFTAYRVACNLHELVNSPWSALDGETAQHMFLEAARMAERFGGEFNEAEAWQSWYSAQRKIGARGRAAPDAGGGVLVGWPQGRVPPFYSGVTDSQQALRGVLNGDHLGVSPHQQGETFAGQASLTPVSPHQQGETLIDSVDDLISRFMSGQQMSDMRPPSWLIQKWIARDSLVHIIGAPGEGKTHIALDMAMCLATGKAWRGMRVKPSRVAFMVAEGAAGLGQRRKAWCIEANDSKDAADLREDDGPGIVFIPFPVQVADRAGWDLFSLAMARLKVDFIVLDTQARITVGLEENSAKEMGLFVEQAENLRRLTSATVAVVHHKNKAGMSARGSGALLGAVSTEISVSRSQDLVTAQVTKQKDDEAPSPVTLRLKTVKTGYRPGEQHGWFSSPGEDISAAILVDQDEAQAREWSKMSAKATIMHIIAELFPSGGGTKAEIHGVARERGMAKPSFYRAWDNLVKDRLIGRVLIDDRLTEKWRVVPVEERDILLN